MLGSFFAGLFGYYLANRVEAWVNRRHYRKAMMEHDKFHMLLDSEEFDMAVEMLLERGYLEMREEYSNLHPTSYSLQKETAAGIAKNMSIQEERGRKKNFWPDFRSWRF